MRAIHSAGRRLGRARQRRASAQVLRLELVGGPCSRTTSSTRRSGSSAADHPLGQPRVAHHQAVLVQLELGREAVVEADEAHPACRRSARSAARERVTARSGSETHAMTWSADSPPRRRAGMKFVSGEKARSQSSAPCDVRLRLAVGGPATRPPSRRRSSSRPLAPDQKPLGHPVRPGGQLVVGAVRLRLGPELDADGAQAVAVERHLALLGEPLLDAAPEQPPARHRA